jgi:flavin reductase (DIM6/NTAB) family NADH-FMN oxidoreductase RutF
VTEKKTFRLDGPEPSDAYKLMSGLIVPRPIGWIGTRREDGTYNLAPFSFFNVVSSLPATVLFSAGRHADRPKDSAEFARSSGEFTVNIVSEEVAEAMNVTSGTFTSADDEFAIAGLTAVPGTVVAAPMVAESPANLECRVTEIHEIGGGSTLLVVGEVVVIHVREDVLDGTRIDNDALRAVGRMAGSTYIHTRDRFEMHRPT